MSLLGFGEGHPKRRRGRMLFVARWVPVNATEPTRSESWCITGNVGIGGTAEQSPTQSCQKAEGVTDTARNFFLGFTGGNGVAQFTGHSAWPDDLFLLGRIGEMMQMNCRMKAEVGGREGREKKAFVLFFSELIHGTRDVRFK